METKSFINSFLFSLHEGNEKTVENNTKNIKEVNEQLKCEEGAYKNWPYPKSFRFLLPETSSAKNLKIPTINNKKVQSLENASHNKYAQDRRYHYHNGRKSDDEDKKRYLPRLFHSWLSTTKNEKPLFNPSFDIETCLPKKHESQKNTKDEILKGFKPLGTSILRPRQSSAPQERITIVDEAVQKSQISIKTTYSNFDMMKGPRNFPRKEKDVKLLQSKRKSLRHSETPPPRPRPPVYPPNATPGDVDNNTNYTFHPSPHRSPPSIGRPSFSRAQESKERDPYQRLKTTKEIREIAVLSSGELIKKETVGVETIPIRKPNAAFNSEATTSKHVKIDEHEDVRVRNIRPVQMSPGTVEYLPLDAAKLEAQSENLLEKLRKNRRP